jgi:hypothetical protein
MAGSLASAYGDGYRFFDDRDPERYEREFATVRFAPKQTFGSGRGLSHRLDPKLRNDPIDTGRDRNGHWRCSASSSLKAYFTASSRLILGAARLLDQC